jgi:hypothetical protein
LRKPEDAMPDSPRSAHEHSSDPGLKLSPSHGWGENKELFELLLEEFRLAWEQYRHVENEKNTYVNYFFSVTLGIVGFSIALLTINGADRLQLMLGISTAAHLYFWLGVTLQINVRKFELVISHYGRASVVLREQLYQGFDANAKHLSDKVNIYFNLTPNFRSTYLRGRTSPQQADGGGDPVSDMVITFCLAAAVLAQLAVLVALISLDAAWWQLTISGAEFALASVGVAFWRRTIRVAP